MPRPITKKDWNARPISQWTETYMLKSHPVLGYYIYDKSDKTYALNVDQLGYFLWVSERTFKRRCKIGHPPPRKPQKKKSRMPESDFSLEELALAETIMNGG